MGGNGLALGPHQLSDQWGAAWGKCGLNMDTVRDLRPVTQPESL